MALSVDMKMWWCAWAVTAWWCAAAGDCDVIVDGRNYTEEVLASSAGWVDVLAVDYSSNTLYFMLYNGSRWNVKLDLETKSMTIIEELSGACAFTVNQARGEVFAGCNTFSGGPGGLYQWDNNTGQFELVGETGRSVRLVHYSNNKLYYSYDKYLLSRSSNGRSVLETVLTSPVWSLVVDAGGDWVFANMTGVYRRRGDGEVSGDSDSRYEGFNYRVSALAADRGGAVYTCDVASPRGVWRLLDTRAATQLLDVMCTALTFDADGNIIYADMNRSLIVRLLPC